MTYREMNNIQHLEKTTLPLKGSFFPFLVCIEHAKSVNIITMIGSKEKDHKKSEPLGTKGIRFCLGYPSYFIRLCRILYIVDRSTFLASEKAWQLHKNGGVYAI
ncbi:hypothetical protein [Metabacillus rhizolycopersici]|uniref:Uncharacterized protein n=1 Tax=Metabacillus rhizolycopersici TaxID=2875709 RepID=A0ABS7UZY4_9BACI|nr:hypothetical protein [Metabacillus rhizolycopersici]MBZ5753460.1 hypothetical protein [Metabacillus rhizolycopersici]